MYQPFAHGSNRGAQRPAGQVPNVPQQQQLNYQRVYAASNQYNQNPQSNQQLNQQVKPSSVVFPQQQVYGNNPAPQAVPLGTQNINRQSQQVYYPQQQQQQQQQVVNPQRYSQYTQQQKAQQYRIINGTQYSSASSQSVSSQPQQQMFQKPTQQYYQQSSTPQNYSSVPSTQTSKSATMYQAQQGTSTATYDGRTMVQQVQQQKQQQQVATAQAPQQFNANQPQNAQQMQVHQTAGALDQSIKRLYTSIQALQIQLQTLTSAYQLNFQQKKMTVEELNIQRSQYKLQLENIYNQCRKISSEYPTILCLVTRLPNGDIGIRRANGVNSTEKEINNIISFIEQSYLQFSPNNYRQDRQPQQSLIPVTIQNEQVVRSTVGQGVRDSAISTHANLNMKKSTENLKTIIEESRERIFQEKENSNYYSPIIRAYARGRDIKVNNVNVVEDDQEIIHQYGSTQKERMNTSPDVVQTTDRGQVERISYRIVNPPAGVVSGSRNPIPGQQNFQRQFTFNDGQNKSQMKQTGTNYAQAKDYSVTQPDILTYEPMFKDLYDETERERVKRSNAYSVVGNNLTTLNPAPYTPMIAGESKQRLSTVPQQVVVFDQFKQAQDFNKLLKDTKQFNLQTTSKDLQKLMDEEKYEQVSEYAYETLSLIDRQIINMKATVEQALEQTELTITKNLLLEIIESLHQTVKSKEIDISHRVISKIQKNTARLLKDKTASYSLYLYLQKITNYLKERENILNHSIQANEMSLLNQTDHSFWMNNKIDNNDPNQIIPIIENAKKNSCSTETGSTLNFQFFLRDLDLPTYVPMKEQIRMQEEVRQSIQTGVGLSTMDSKVRASVTPIHGASQNNFAFSSAQKPYQFQNQLIESTTSASMVEKKFGNIQPPEYVPYGQSKSVERPKSAQSSNILGYRSPVNVNPTTDIFNSNASITNLIAASKDSNAFRENKFIAEDESVKRSSTIPSRIFATGQDEQIKKSSPNNVISQEFKPLNQEFAHQRKIIKTQFATSPNKSVPLIRPEDKKMEAQNIVNTPSLTEKKIIQIQKIASAGTGIESNKNSDVKVVNANNNYSINHLMTPAGSKVNKASNNGNLSVTSINNNTSNLDNILNKYRIGDIEKQIQQGQVQNGQDYSPNVVNNNKNIEISNNETIIYSQVEGFGKRDEEVVKRSAPHSQVIANHTTAQEDNRENNPEFSVGQKKQINLQYESIIDKYIPNNNEKALVLKYGLNQTSRPALEQVNNQILAKNYSTQNILKAPTAINTNDPLQSVSDKYNIVINQQQESLQRTSFNFNAQQQQKKFYDLALKLKSGFPKTHKANTILVNQMWEIAQNIPENEWQNYILEQCNSAK